MTLPIWYWSGAYDQSTLDRKGFENTFAGKYYISQKNQGTLTSNGTESNPTENKSTLDSQSPINQNVNIDKQSISNFGNSKPSSPSYQKCNWKVIKPSLTYVLVDNRKLCYCCNTQYAIFTSNKAENIQSIKIGHEIDYLEALLDKHVRDVNADDDHREADRKKVTEFVLKTYGTSINTVIQSFASVYTNAFSKLFIALMDPQNNTLNNKTRKIEKYSINSDYCSLRCKNDPRCN